MPIKAVWRGREIAKSDDTIVVEGNHYFDLADVDQDLLIASETTSFCPWKGNANYYSITVDGETKSDAAWTYVDPKDAAIDIKNRIAFWRGVEVKES